MADKPVFHGVLVSGSLVTWVLASVLVVGCVTFDDEVRSIGLPSMSASKAIYLGFKDAADKNIIVEGRRVQFCASTGGAWSMMIFDQADAPFSHSRLSLLVNDQDLEEYPIYTASDLQGIAGKATERAVQAGFNVSDWELVICYEPDTLMWGGMFYADSLTGGEELHFTISDGSEDVSFWYCNFESPSFSGDCFDPIDVQIE